MTESKYYIHTYEHTIHGGEFMEEDSPRVRLIHPIISNRNLVQIWQRSLVEPSIGAVKCLVRRFANGLWIPPEAGT